MKVRRMKKTLSIPLGGTIRVKREDGAHEVFVFRGSDERGVIYEDAQGNRHGDIGVYLEIALKSGSGWTVL